MRRELRAVWALVHGSIWTLRRHPFLLLGEIVRPIFWLIFVSLGMSVLGSGRNPHRAHTFVFAGILVLTILQSGLRRAGFLVDDRKAGFLRALALAPSSSLALGVGIVIANTVLVTLQTLLFTLIAGVILLRLPAASLAPLAATIALVGAGTVAAGLWLASIPWRAAVFRTVIGIVTLPAYFLSGGVIPLDRAPEWLRPVIRANPFTYAVDLVRHAMGAPAAFTLVADLTLAIAFAAAMMALAWVVFHRRRFDLRAQRVGRRQGQRPGVSQASPRVSAPEAAAGPSLVLVADPRDASRRSPRRPLGRSVGEEGLLEAARRQTGLSDFGDEGFREGLRALVSGCAGKPFVLRRVTEALVNRLRFRAALRRVSEASAIATVPIPRPLVIASLPRSGTTLLHNLLAQDPAAHAPTFWEMHEPPPADPPSAEDPRIGRAIASLAHLPADIRIAHEFDPMAPGECASLFRNSLIYPLWGLQSAAYFDWLRDQDLASGYAEYADQLRLLSRSRPDPATHLVVKWSFHIWRLEALLRTFPEAGVVLIHRDPVRLIPSYCSLLSMQFRNRDAPAVGRFVTRYLAELARRMIAARDRFPSDRFLDIGYGELCRDPVATVRRIHQQFGYPFSTDLAGRLEGWIAKNPQGKHGVHHYGLAEYGLEEEAVRAEFAGYLARFGIGREPARDSAGARGGSGRRAALANAKEAAG